MFVRQTISLGFWDHIRSIELRDGGRNKEDQ
jgi:hypothetical protein